MPVPKRTFPPVIITHPQSDDYDQGYDRIFGSEPRGPLARKKAEEAQANLPPYAGEEDWRDFPKD